MDRGCAEGMIGCELGCPRRRTPREDGGSVELRPGYKQTDVGSVPVSWQVCDLVAVSSQITDGDHLTPKRVRSGYYLLSARNIRDGRVDLLDVDYVDAGEFKRMRQRCAPEVGDILISCSGHGLGSGHRFHQRRPDRRRPLASGARARAGRGQPIVPSGDRATCR